MLLWYSILFLIVAGFLIYWFYPRQKEGFQSASDTPVNIDVIISPDKLQSAINTLEQNGIDTNNVDASGIPVAAYDSYTHDNTCAQYRDELNNYNSELQRHRIAGNWTHVDAMKSYINIVSQRLIASSCPSN